jgi:antitoxin VapB
MKKGMSEEQLAGEMSKSLWSRGVLPAVLLVGGDERQIAYRHAIPTALPVHRHAMLVACGNYKGLILSLTRMIAFSEPPESLLKKQQACIRVEAAMWAASRPGARSGEVFNAAKAAYAAEGFPAEELKHHQGGAAGYEPREWLGGVHDELIVENTPLAWNPSISGGKSEDTILCGSAAHEILTAPALWPSIKTEFQGKPFERPGFLLIKEKA